MTDVTDQFFDALARRQHEPLLRKVTGSIRFNLAEGARSQRWLLLIDRGALTVSQADQEADTVIHADRASFDEIVSGRLTPLAAWLRNDIMVQGRFQLLIMLDRLLPGRLGARHPREVGRAVRAERA